MKKRRHFVIHIAAMLLATLLVSCNQSKQEPVPAARTAALSATASEKVFVTFEGPWALVADPKDPNMILALAPKTKAHLDLNVSASNDVTLAAGVYELSVPAHGAAATAALDPTFAQVKIDAKSLQHALDDKSARYVIRLPKPEAYAAAGRRRARIGTAYPPDASSEQNFANQVSLRYSVASLTGFSLAGTPDTGSFNPMLLQVDTPAIRFAIAPAAVDPADLCSTHSRESFRDLVKFLDLTLYVDFPDEASDCHKTDPQVRPAKADAQTPNQAEPRAPAYPAFLAQVEPESLERVLLAAMYFFHTSGPICKAPILFLTVS